METEVLNIGDKVKCMQPEAKYTFGKTGKVLGIERREGETVFFVELVMDDDEISNPSKVGYESLRDHWFIQLEFLQKVREYHTDMFGFLTSDDNWNKGNKVFPLLW
jgi:hypothetical protein